MKSVFGPNVVGVTLKHFHHFRVGKERSLSKIIDYQPTVFFFKSKSGTSNIFSALLERMHDLRKKEAKKKRETLYLTDHAFDTLKSKRADLVQKLS